MNIDHIHKLFLESSGICTDTRKLNLNCIFFALKGENFNGNEYASKAIQLGASYAIIDDINYQKDKRFILVENVLETLQKLAKFHRNKLRCPVIGITGTNGKTTTKELIFAVLNTKFKTVCTQGNLNNNIGVPLTILSTPLETEMLIVEMGANHIGEIKFLCEIAKIDYGIITNIGKAHLEGYGSFDNIIKTKNELYQFVKKNNKKLFVNKNDNLLLELSEGIDRTFYTDFNNPSEEESLATVIVNQQTIKTQLVGAYNKDNIIAAYTIGFFFGVKEIDIINSLQKYTPSNNRSELKITKADNTLILDAYNANPTSMKASIESFLAIKKKSYWLILGDMLELGESSLKEHQNIINNITKSGTENVLLIGDEFGKCNHTFKHFESVNSAEFWIRENSIENSHILLKGSRGIKLEKLEMVL